ncbi:MAG: ATP-binding protein [Candidatus Sulfobium sp.]
MIIKTFRLRLTLFYTGAVVLMIAAFCVLLYWQYKGQLMDRVDAQLIDTARELMVSRMKPKTLTRDQEIIIKTKQEYFQIVNYSGQIIITSLSQNQQWPLDKGLMLSAFHGNAGYETVKFMGGDYRTIYFPVNGETIIRVGQSLDETGKTLAGLRKLLMLFSPVVLVVCSLMGWFFAGWALNPVLEIKNLAEQIRRGRMRGRINTEPKGRELDELAVIFNDMLQSIQRSVEMQKRFVSDVSHEIRSPLTALRGNIEVALRRRRSVEDYENILESGLTDVVRLSRITDDLLFLTKADNNILELRQQWFELGPALSAIVERLENKAVSSGVSLIEDYRVDLEVYGDAFLLDQAFSNLVENAIKYTPKGGKVTVTTEEKEGSVLVIVSDTGIGIPTEDIPHLFERFYRVDKERSRRAGGTGLGLSITEWIIKAHKGTISVESTFGSGSDFIVSLPKDGDRR